MRAYGSVAIQDIAKIDNPLRFQGPYFDAETGLHCKRHRYYNPRNGRYLRDNHKDLIVRKKPTQTHRHRYMLLKKLENTLHNKDFDFSALFDNDDDDDYTSAAWESHEIDDPRGFFEDIYRIAMNVWKEDIEKAKPENQDEW